MRNALAAALVAACALAAHARAQEAIFTDAATQPSLDQWVVRTQFSYTRYSSDPTSLDRDIDEFTLSTLVSYGVHRDVSIAARLPLVYRNVDSPDPGADGDEFNLADVPLTLKWRIWREDTGPIDTTRLSLIAGLEVPTYNELSNDGWDPSLGAVLTTIHGRHGLSVAAQWKFTTDGEDNPVRPGEGSADLFRGDLAYLYRIDPAEYQADTEAAAYLVLEANTFAETNGDTEVLLAPGILYEARRFALEAAVQLPAWQSLDHRPESNFTIILGVRLLF